MVRSQLRCVGSFYKRRKPVLVVVNVNDDQHELRAARRHDAADRSLAKAVSATVCIIKFSINL